MSAARNDGNGRTTRVLNADARRSVDVQVKHARVRRLLNASGFDSLLLQQPTNIAWFAAGADVTRGASCEASSAVFVTPEARVVLTNNVDSQQLFERELYGLGFQLKERAWFDDHRILLNDLCRGRKVASDTGIGRTRNISRRLTKLRLPLTGLECERMQRLGKVVTHAVEATAMHVERGKTEADVAGEIAHRLIKRTVFPERIAVCADGRSERFRHWKFGSDPINGYAVLSCVARRWGLCVGAARTVCLGSVPADLKEAHRAAALMHATGLFFTQPDETLRDVWQRVARIYEKFGRTHEWHLADQAEVCGYENCELAVTPRSDFRLREGLAVHWHPSVEMARCGDTILLTSDGAEVLTASRRWPSVSVRVRGHIVECPDVLALPQTSQSPRSDISSDTAQQLAMMRDSILSGPDSAAESMDSVWEMDELVRRESP